MRALVRFRLISIVLVAFVFFTGCNKEEQKKFIDQINDQNLTGGDVNGTLPQPFPDIETYLDQITNPPAYDCGCNVDEPGVLKTIVTGVVVDNAKSPIKGAEVRIGKIATYSDSEGKFTLMDIPANQSVVINFFHKAYSTNSRIMYAAAGSENFIEQPLAKIDASQTANAGADITLLSSNNAFARTSLNVQKDGKYYEGKVKATLSYLGITDRESIMKFVGDFKGDDSNGVEQSLVSYGMINLELKDEKGLKVELQDGAGSAFLKFPANPNTDNQEIIPLFSYNYHEGKWKEEGYATRQSDGTYTSFVPHCGVWSLSKPVEEAYGTTYTGRIIHPDGSPAKNVEVYAVGKNWMKKDVTTDNDGNFEIDDMVPGDTWRLKAYTKDDKHSAEYNHDMTPMEIGEIRNDQKF